MSDSWCGEGIKRPCTDDMWSTFASRVRESRLQKRHCVGRTFSEMSWSMSWSASGLSSEMKPESTSVSYDEICFFPCSSLCFCRWGISGLMACVSYCSSDTAGSSAIRRLKLYILPLLAPRYNASRSFLLPWLSHMRTLELAGFESNRASVARKYRQLGSHFVIAFFAVGRCRRSGNLNVGSVTCER
jgi:hypothetical protein